MTTALTATELRRNVYNVLDEVLESGKAQEIVRRGQKLLIVPAQPKKRSFATAPRRKILKCSFDELVATSWEDAWKPDP